jgi:hypothetical protein
MPQADKRRKVFSIQDEIEKLETEINELDDKDDEEDLPPPVIYNDGKYNYTNSAVGGSQKEKEKEKKQLTLSDVLNQLDGVHELNGCFVILTTNHKEKLDPALIRPGRMTYDLHLGPIQKPEMLEMLNWFLPDLEQQLKAKADWKPLNLQIASKKYKSDSSGLSSDSDESENESESSDENLSWQQLLDFYLDQLLETNIMACRFESFCIMKDPLPIIIQKMDAHFQWIKEEEEKMIREEEEAKKQAEIEAREEIERQRYWAKHAEKLRTKKEARLAKKIPKGNWELVNGKWVKHIPAPVTYGAPAYSDDWMDSYDYTAGKTNALKVID